MVQAFAVAERQRDVTRSFSRKEHKQEDQTSTAFTLLLTVAPLFESSMTPNTIVTYTFLIIITSVYFFLPDVQTGDDRSDNH